MNRPSPIAIVQCYTGNYQLDPMGRVPEWASSNDPSAWLMEQTRARLELGFKVVMFANPAGKIQGEADFTSNPWPGMTQIQRQALFDAVNAATRQGVRAAIYCGWKIPADLSSTSMINSREPLGYDEYLTLWQPLLDMGVSVFGLDAATRNPIALVQVSQQFRQQGIYVIGEATPAVNRIDLMNQAPWIGLYKATTQSNTLIDRPWLHAGRALAPNLFVWGRSTDEMNAADIDDLIARGYIPSSNDIDVLRLIAQAWQQHVAGN